MKESVSGPCPLALPTPQQAPQQYVLTTTPSRAATKPHPKPGGDEHPTRHATYPTTDRKISQSKAILSIVLSSSLVRKKFFYKHVGRQYSATPESPPTTSDAPPVIIGPPLMIPHPNNDPPLRIPCIPLCRNVHNPQARAAHNYSLVNDLAQSLATMLVLEVLQTFPTQWKLLLSTLGEVDPADTRLITFDLDSGEPRLPTLITFQIPVKICNITVHHCIIDEGASTCIMSKFVWQKLGSPKLIPSSITLRVYDRIPSSPEGFFQNIPIELRGKTILIEIEVIDAPLNYNILFGHSYMYAMKFVVSSMFRTMMFPP
jgi:hypothetical protein